ncbi:MAG: hypothetical protein RSB67_01855 [Clostridia bacterium]
MSKFSKKYNNIKEKVSLDYNLEIGRLDEKLSKDSEYEFIPEFNHWLSSDEQKIKTDELEKITKEKK